MDTPSPINWADLISSNPDLTFRVDLLVSAPDPETLVSVTDVVPVVDAGYGGQTVGIEEYGYDDEGNLFAQLEPATFPAEFLTANYSVVAYAVSAIFDDGFAIAGTVNFDNPVQIGPGLKPLGVAPLLEIVDLSSLPLNFS